MQLHIKLVLHDTGKMCVGVIKDICQSQQTVRWFSRALQNNELFLIAKISDLLKERLEDW